MPENDTLLPNFYPGVIHVRKADSITIDHFCFFDIDFGPENTNSKLVSRGTDIKTNDVQPIHVVMINCTYNCTDFYVAVDFSPNVNNQELIGCKANTVNSNPISQLNLGECRGKVTAPAFEIQYPIEPSFSASEIVPINNPNNDNNKKNNKAKIALIAGIAGGVALLIIVALIVAIVVIKKRKATVVEDIDVAPENGDGVHNENLIYDRDADDDPFRNDFVDE